MASRQAVAYLDHAPNRGGDPVKWGGLTLFVVLLFVGGCDSLGLVSRGTNNPSNVTENDASRLIGNRIGVMEAGTNRIQESVLVDKGVLLYSTADTEPVTHRFQVHNQSDVEVRVEPGGTSCNCTLATLSSDVIPPDGLINVDVNISASASGRVQESASIIVSGGNRLTMGLKMDRLPRLEIESPPNLVFVPSGDSLALELEITGREFGDDSRNEFFAKVLDGPCDAMAIGIHDVGGWEIREGFIERRGRLQVVFLDPLAALGVPSMSKRILVGVGDEEIDVAVAWRTSYPISCDPGRFVVRSGMPCELSVVISGDIAFSITEVHVPPFLEVITALTSEVRRSHILELHSRVDYIPKNGFEREKVVVRTSDVRQPVVEISALCWSVSGD